VFVLEILMVDVVGVVVLNIFYSALVIIMVVVVLIHH
jgi:hypothetical protein